MNYVFVFMIRQDRSWVVEKTIAFAEGACPSTPAPGDNVEYRVGAEFLTREVTYRETRFVSDPAASGTSTTVTVSYYVKEAQSRTVDF